MKYEQYVICDQYTSDVTLESIKREIAILSDADLRTLRAIINGKLSKRTITKEQQDAMQAAKLKKKG